MTIPFCRAASPWVMLLAIAGSASCTRQAEQPPAASSAPYGFEAVRFEPGSEGRASVGMLELVLRNPDNPERPTAWEGPLELRRTQSGTPCEAEPSLITHVYLDTATAVALVVSYSGSMTFLDFIDTSSCQSKWPQIGAATKGVTVSGDRVSLSPVCETDGSRSRCSAGQVFRLAPDQPPARLEEESRELTRAQLGVDFTGEAWVEGVGTASARVVPPVSR